MGLYMRRCVWSSGLAAALLAAALSGAAPFRPGHYTIEAQTVMPHLEEMRRIRTREARCLDGTEWHLLFPVLAQRAFTGCGFGHARREAARVELVLVCHSARVATGTALLEISSHRIIGDLHVKMGGKNMTFSQHVVAVHRGACPSATEPPPVP